VLLNEVWYPGIQAYWTAARPVVSMTQSGIKAVVIQATAGSDSEGAISVMKADNAGFHWLLPDEDEPHMDN